MLARTCFSLEIEANTPNSHYSCGISRIIGTPYPLHGHQAPADHEQIRQCTSDKQTIRVLLQSTITHICKSKHSLDDAQKHALPLPAYSTCGGWSDALHLWVVACSTAVRKTSPLWCLAIANQDRVLHILVKVATFSQRKVARDSYFKVAAHRHLKMAIHSHCKVATVSHTKWPPACAELIYPINSKKFALSR